ncbi:lipocalin family protein [Flavobacterium sp. C3NV]|uniref:lipocalin family protein n=1 Tax=Flavobacterium sp. C3NV TaxID=3393358 RepID=UPI00398FC573
MKKLLLLPLLLMVLTSCTQESDTIPDDTSGDIQGTWQLKALYVSGVRQSLSPCRLNQSMVFEQNSVVMVQPDETGNASCTLSTIKGTFTRTDKNLTIAFNDENWKIKIKELTAVKLLILPENSEEALQYEKAP